MWLRTAAGTWVQITAIDHTHRTARVHNLTVDGVHTYYALAGRTQLLVHNDGCPTFVRNQKVPEGENLVGFKYQRHVTGQNTEQVWKLNSGRHAGRDVHVDGGPTTDGFIVEAKFTGRNAGLDPGSWTRVMRLASA
ncbi:hypothetical protein [Streptomyces atacamensis]|uniref:hypothetical protein n=1 Tax=Streptomyces atacamensis TaxID=531966 RepID=UPI00399C71EA